MPRLRNIGPWHVGRNTLEREFADEVEVVAVDAVYGLLRETCRMKRAITLVWVRCSLRGMRVHGRLRPFAMPTCATLQEVRDERGGEEPGTRLGLARASGGSMRRVELLQRLLDGLHERLLVGI